MFASNWADLQNEQDKIIYQRLNNFPPIVAEAGQICRAPYSPEGIKKIDHRLYHTTSPRSKFAPIYGRKKTHTKLYSLSYSQTYTHVSCERVGQTIPWGVIWGEEIQTFRNSLLTPCVLSSESVIGSFFFCGVWGLDWLCQWTQWTLLC